MFSKFEPKGLRGGLRRNVSGVIKRVSAVVLVLAMVSCSAMTASAAGKTGIGMAEWAMRAYNEGWKYVYGGSEVGAVDCSGLIRSYIKGGGGAKALLNAASKSGNISSMPRVHGLGLWCEGHAGVYVGKNESGVNMAVDARNSRVNMVYSEMSSRTWNPWVKWFKISGVTYPDTGWETFNGKKYYYEDGQFVVGIHTVDGVTYDFGKSGVLKGEVDLTKTTTAAATTTTKATTTTTRKTTTTTKASNALKKGSSGDAVTKLQKRLIELGYMKVEATGYYGEKTAEAVKAFQRRASLEADGIAGEATQKRLYASDAPRATTTTARATTTTTTTTMKPTTTTTAATTTTTAATTAPTTTASKQTQATTTQAQTTAQTKSDKTEQKTTDTTTTATTTTEPEILYETLEFGSSGREVRVLQERMTELGYYDHDISDYYGVFLRLAVMSFQLDAGLPATGVADNETQIRAYAEDAPLCGEAVTGDLLYTEEELQEDGGELADEQQGRPQEQESIELAASKGLDGYSRRSDIMAFISQYGDSGALSTLGVYSYSAPEITIYKNGESYSISDEMSGAMSDCVFY